MQSDQKDSDFMPKLDIERDKSKLKYSDIIYMKQAEEAAVQRASQYTKRRNKCAKAGFALAGLSLGIYLYTIYAVKQETFLNDLYEPEKIIEKSSSKTNVA
ncbi:cytochrome c oxidase assembly factor 3, mitochondrial [Bombus terrestris]|uniref:Cytochrome c oxidase assembly factor 3 n=1 Tax=Bombus terrestris TaxID=30195 RepID=A0A9B0BUC7_BOMTE|nr:cytochrome c oxidase assembly factor 3, mitochondrial [Bombus terrestris]XP_048262112.1 cytochrome c oxidase assembly factor 3, mitochondrial [Bombus terrestris]